MLSLFPKITLAICLLATITLCGCQNMGQKSRPEKNSSAEATVTDLQNQRETISTETAEGKVIPLTATAFRQLVFDYKNEQNWKYLNDRPCVIDFYADWCRPCKAMEPVMEKMAVEFSGKVRFYKVNVDNESELANYFQINSIPFVLYCPLNDMPKSTMGGLPEEELRKYITFIL